MPLHSAFAAKLNTTVLAGLTSLDVATQPEVDNESSIGSPFPQFVVITAQKPRIQFATRAVATTLAVTGSTGAAISASANFFAYFAQIGADGLTAAGSVHRSYTATRGLLLPRRLSVNHRSNATLDVEALCYSSDGAAHPLAIADNAALPTIAQNNIQHTLGGITLGTTGVTFALSCAQSLSIDFGQDSQTIGCGSDLYDAHVQQASIRPVITITGLDATAFGASGVPPVGKAMAHAATRIYLRKRSVDGVAFVPNGTAEHIKLTVHGVGVVTQHNAQGTARAEVTLQITCGWDGTNAPIVIDTASTIV